MTEDGDPDGQAKAQVVIGLLADPDLPTVIAHQVADDLPELLSQRVSDRVSWTVEPISDPFEAAVPGFDRLIDKARERVRETNWDLAICITDVPIRTENGVVVADVSAVDHVALLSLPALGGVLLRPRTREVIVPLVDYLTPRTPRPPGAEPPARPSFRRRSIGTVRAAHLVAPTDHDIGVEVVATRGNGLPRLLAGMVRANRPWQLVLGLSGAMAGAMTGTAFGVLYSSIWQLAGALGPLRLAVMTTGAIATLVVWLIASHELWERPPGPRDGRGGSSVGLRNAGTVFTVAFGALVFFLGLFVITFSAVVVVIPLDYLGTVLGRPAGWHDHVTVSLMAAILGTVAGAVGSGLEDDLTVRRAAYGYRERERWRQVRADNERAG